MMSSMDKIMKTSLNFALILGCLFSAVVVQSAERVVLCEEFTNRY